MPQWHCEGSDLNLGCPKYMPRIGSPCTPPAGDVVNCIYGCEWGTATCWNRVWQRGPNVCPVSRRAYKEDVRYLSDDDVAALGRAVQSLRLARYRYKTDPPASPSNRLGFIIDDLEGPSPAVMADGNHVDLYSYASMLVGALQEQERELGRLRREVQALRRELRRGSPSGH
jgi:hypothetical protein